MSISWDLSKQFRTRSDAVSDQSLHCLHMEMSIEIQMERYTSMGCRFTIYSQFMDVQNSFLDIHNSFLDIQKWF